MRKAPPVKESPVRPPQQGFILVLAAAVLTGLLAVALVGVQRTRNHTSQATRNYQETRAFYAAEGGGSIAQAWLIQLLHDVPNPSQTLLNTVPRPTLPGFDFVTYSINRQPRVPGQPIASGPYAGMLAEVQPFEILSRAENGPGTNDGIVRIRIDEQLIGMYQFGIFYDGDLEFFPPYSMDFHGRIHTNGNLYIGSTDILSVDGALSAAGHIYRTPKDPTRTYNGKARITDERGRWQDLRYDSRAANWPTRSLDDWGGHVLDSAHTMTTVSYPLPVPANTIDIIKRGLPTDDEELLAKRFYYKAGLRIIDGVLTDSAGMALAVVPTFIAQQMVWDHREQRFMHMNTIDIAALTGSGALPANRVIYVSYTGGNEAVRLKNGATLPAGGLVVATDLPLYIQGNYNSVNKKPASVLCDAFNVYSNNWSDAISQTPLNSRIAAHTQVYTCVVSGNTPTTAGHYNGGVENLVRLHEKWVGHELTIRGSMVCIWESQRARGDFANASFVESHRDWGYDPQLLNPSFWPVDDMALRFVSRTRWQPK